MKTHNAKWLLIALILIFAAMFSTAIAEGEILDSGTCGANARWEVDSEGTLTISGTGKMKDYEHDEDSEIPNTPWYEYKFSIENVVIEEGITHIGSDAFYRCHALTSISIPDGVTSIGEYAFYRCEDLTGIPLPEGVTSIGKAAFMDCTGLTSITLPEGLTMIDDEVFIGCSALPSIAIPDGVTSIGYRAFVACTSLTSITLPEGLISIGDAAFSGCTSLPGITLPESVTSIGGSAFLNCTGLTSITLPNGITSISNYIFSRCTGLTSITFPERVTSIGDYAFQECVSLTSIAIPEGVTSIGTGTFNNCTGLTSITLPESLTSIGDYNTFKNCSSLTSITLPNGVTSIGVGAFQGCSELTGITLPEGLTSIAYDAFRKCSSLTSIDIPDGVTSIGLYAFRECSSLMSISLPEGLTSIGNETFYYCTSLKSIAIPDGVISIGASAFYYCSSLKSVTLPVNLASIGASAFKNCSSLTNITFPEKLTSIDTAAFQYCSSLTSITFPESLTDIRNLTFSACTGLTSIAILGGDTTISTSAFSTCTSLKSVAIPNGLKTVYSDAFYNCKNLTDVYAGSVESWVGIDFRSSTSNPMCYADHLHFDNELAVNITIPDGVTSIGPYTFQNCSSLTGIDLPDSVTSIGESAFRGCTGLTSIAIPDGVTSIDYYTFYNCSSLTSIVIPESVESIKSYAFSGCSKLTKVYLLGEEAPKFTFSTYFDKSKVTIYCHEFSEVDFWAVENGYSCVYVDPEAPESLSISLSAETEFYPGEALKLRVNTFPRSASKYPIAWASSDDGVVAVRGGVPTAVSTGTATLTASCGSLSDSVTVTVLPVTTPKSLVLPEDARLAIDVTLTIQVETSPLAASEYSIVWESSNPEVATVENGVVHPVSAGTTTITASCGIKSDSMEVTVYEEMRSFELSASELWLVSKETAQLTVENILPAGATGYTFTWKSSDTTILTVEEGAITAKVPGDAVVTVTSSNGISRQCTVHVCYPVTAIEFEESRITMSMDAPKQLTASVTTRGQSLINKLVTFASSDETVAAVDKNGLVTAVKSGNTTITATAANGITASCEIIVRNPNTLTLSQGVKTIKTKAFFGVAVEEIVIPNGCRQIDAQAFANNSKLVFVYMPDSITLIADDAFDGCDSLHFVCESKNTAAEYAEKHNIPYSIED